MKDSHTYVQIQNTNCKEKVCRDYCLTVAKQRALHTRDASELNSASLASVHGAMLSTPCCRFIFCSCSAVVWLDYQAAKQ